MYLYEFWEIFEEVVSINCDSFGLAFCDNEVVLNASRTANGRRDGGGRGGNGQEREGQGSKGIKGREGEGRRRSRGRKVE